MKFLHLSLLILVLLSACSTEKKVVSSTVTEKDLIGNKIAIIGLIEFDYSELKHKEIRGIDLYFDSKKTMRDFKLSETLLPVAENKYYRFITALSDTGLFNLIYKKNLSKEEKEKLKKDKYLQNMYEITDGSNIIQKYTLDSGKIINIGKIVVKYTGGDVNNGKISYNYGFQTVLDDSLALMAFKEAYPAVYAKHKNETYITMKCDSHRGLEYILNNVPQDKSKLILAFINEHPEKINKVFSNLSPQTQEKIAEKIKSFSMTELKSFLQN